MRLSFRTKLFLPLVLSWICLLTVMTVSVMRDRTLRMEERQTQLRNAGDMALSVVNEYAALAKSGALPEAEAKKQALERVKNLRFGETGYFTVLDSKVVLMNPFKQELVGTSTSVLKDQNGNQVYLDAIKASHEPGGGYSTYMWPKPGGKEALRKLAYNNSYQPWDWTFMTGLYVDDLETAFYRDLLISAALLAGIGIVLTGTILLLVRNIEGAIGGEPGQAAFFALKIAEGDLNVAIPLRKGDRTSLLYAMDSMRDGLGGIVRQVRLATHSIRTASGEIAAGNLDLSSRTEQQASSLEETAASMEQLTATVKQSAENAQQANQLARTASAVAAEGHKVVGEAVARMNSISASSRRIVDIIAVIEGIAFQTNILALNAAVEAARAGEQGRGFAVVASEVRSLAHRSAAAAKEIKDLINDSAGKVTDGTTLVHQAGATMKDIVVSVQHVTDIMGEIMAATQEQTVGISEINRAVSQMDQVTQQNAALVEEAAAASGAMEKRAIELAQLVGAFRIDEA